MRYLLRLSFALLVFLAFTQVLAAPERVTCYTLWDSTFFYAAFEVQDRDVESTNTTHMSNPWEDDCVEVFLETDDKRAPDRSSNTYQMSVSAGGGSSFVVGENGQPVPKKIFSFKYAKKVQGTLNRPIDRDIGYTIELAIPWKEMGGPPVPGQRMGFNVICRMRGENTGFVSFSPDVQTPEDVHIPAKWGRILFTDVPTIVALQDGAVVCRKVLRTPPVINGILGPSEWIPEMRFQMVKPEPPATRPGDEFLLEKLSLTHYFYWYQADPRKEAPFTHVRHEDGTSAITDHPLRGVGPWFSSDRVQWHKDELSDVRNAGIDIIIPVYWGSAAQRREFASKGLNCMVQALKELKAEGKSYPLVGMFFDTSAMWVQYGEKPDLRQDEVKETFYGMIKDFFLNVPEEFRAVVQVPPEKGGYPAYIVVLYAGEWFSDMDSTFVEYCNKRFAEDFGGRRLVWIANAAFRPKAAVMDGYTNYGAGLGVQFDDTGWIDIAGVGAGYDDTAVRGRTTPIRSRMGGNTYKLDWDTVIGKSPDWVIVDGWNELHEGSDICASAEYGDRYIGLTRINMLRFNGLRDYDAKFLKHDTPSVLVPGAMYQVTLTVKNAGTKPWYPGQGIYLAGRWFKDGALYMDTDVRLPIQETVLAGQVITKTVGIRITDRAGNPMPEGDYELRWELVKGRDEWFSNAGDTPLCVPVKLAANASPGFTLVSSTAPTLMKSGATYGVALRIRNDGPSVWKGSTAKVGYRWYRVSVHLGRDSEDRAELIGANESAFTLPADVQPGRIADVVLPVATVTSDGTPLPVWTQDALWTYVLKWDVFDGEKWLGAAGVGSSSEAVKVTSTDYGPRFVSSTTPEEMPAGKRQNVTVTLENTGPDVWTKADFSVGYHWYYLDGTEALWDGGKFPLPSDVQPGKQVTVKATVTPPSFDGRYFLVWDLAHQDTWSSTTAITRGSDILVVPVKVTKGRLVALDLTGQLDTDVVTFDTNRSDGDADGAGGTLPGEFMPLPGDWTPCGIWATTGTKIEGQPAPIFELGAQGSHQSSQPLRRISFMYPPKADGAKNAISCNGQTIEFKPGRYAAIHLLVLASRNVTAEIGIGYDQVRTSSIVLPGWGEKPAGSLHPALAVLHRHTPQGDQRDLPSYLAHVEIAADPVKEARAIILPKEPALKILAVTLEKAQ